MKKIIFGAMTLLALVAFSSNSYAKSTVIGDNNSSAKCGQGKCSCDKTTKCKEGKCSCDKTTKCGEGKCNSDKSMKCGAGKCGGGK